MGEWAVRWMFAEPDPAQVDPVTLTWWMHLRVDRPQLPDRRVVIEFDYRGPDAVRIWLVLDRGEPSVCVKHPGFDSDVIVTADPVSMMRVFSGIIPLTSAVNDGSVRLDGIPSLTQGFGHWFLWSPFATAMRELVASR